MIVPVGAETVLASAGGVFSEPWLLGAALSTAAVETPIFWLCGYRRRAELLWFAVVNLVSNLLLNEFLMEVSLSLAYEMSVGLGEVFVVLLEFALCEYTVREKRGVQLFRVLLLTNAASFFAGMLYFFVL